MGLRTLLLWENLSNIIIPSLGHASPWGGGMGFDCTESPSFLPVSRGSFLSLTVEDLCGLFLSMVVLQTVVILVCP